MDSKQTAARPRVSRHITRPDLSIPPAVLPPPTPDEQARWEQFNRQMAALGLRLTKVWRDMDWDMKGMPVCPSEALVAEYERQSATIEPATQQGTAA